METTSTNWGSWIQEIGKSAIGAYADIEKSKNQRDALRSNNEGMPVMVQGGGGLLGMSQGMTLLLIGGAVVLAVVMLKD